MWTRRCSSRTQMWRQTSSQTHGTRLQPSPWVRPLTLSFLLLILAHSLKPPALGSLVGFILEFVVWGEEEDLHRLVLFCTGACCCWVVHMCLSMCKVCLLVWKAIVVPDSFSLGRHQTLGSWFCQDTMPDVKRSCRCLPPVVHTAV